MNSFGAAHIRMLELGWLQRGMLLAEWVEHSHEDLAHDVADYPSISGEFIWRATTLHFEKGVIKPGANVQHEVYDLLGR